jgi:uncharacterized protein YjiS (DUF1127 family)
MRIMDEMNDKSSSSAFDADLHYYSAMPAHQGAANENGSAQSVPEHHAPRRPFITAISSLMAHLIDSLAAYGEAIYPSCVGHSGLTDSHEPTQHSELRRPSAIGRQSNAPWLISGYLRIAEDPLRPAEPRTASPGWSATTASPFIRSWSRMRRARMIRLTITELESLDDHILKDIGLHRSQIGSVARHYDCHNW